MEHSLLQFKKDLKALGINPGDMVMVHSSYKSLGGIENGPEGFFTAFKEYLGEEGTLIFPAFSFDKVTMDNPDFDMQKTPSCVGFLSEYFRTNVEGVVRSIHATHSCSAWGKHAEELVANHELDETPVGKNSPIYKMQFMGGKYLMLGCSTHHLTAMHGVEETAEPPYLFGEEKKRVTYNVTDNGKTFQIPSVRHNFVIGDNYYIQQYGKIADLLDENEVTKGKILDADCVLFDAEAVWKKGKAKLLEDPFYFVYPKKIS